MHAANKPASDPTSTADAPAVGRWRAEVILVSISTVLAVLTYFLKDLSLCAAPLVGVVLALVAAVRLGPKRAPARSAASAHARRRWLRAGALALVPLHLCLGVAALGAARGVGLAAVGKYELRCIGTALASYHADLGEYPPDLMLLAQTGYIADRLRLIAHYDDSMPSEPTESYTSYVYTPGLGPWNSDSRLILAYLRNHGNFSMDWRFRRSPARWVLFADGEVRWLHDDELNRARRMDAERRKEIGWPAPAE
ncbi:MAG: hypothetical protein AB1716_12965 [Planctomycetota bacterium]